VSALLPVREQVWERRLARGRLGRGRLGRGRLGRGRFGDRLLLGGGLLGDFFGAAVFAFLADFFADFFR